MLKVKDIEHRDTAFTRAFTVTHNGEEFRGWLHWNEHDGAWLDWWDVTEPGWVQSWDDSNEEGLVTLIENLTDEVLEGGKK